MIANLSPSFAYYGLILLPWYQKTVQNVKQSFRVPPTIATPIVKVQLRDVSGYCDEGFVLVNPMGLGWAEIVSNAHILEISFPPSPI